MSEQCRYDMFRPSWLDARFQESRPAAPARSRPRRASRRAETSNIALMTVIRQAVSAVKLSRARARSRRDLRALSNHLLQDIGLGREDVEYEFAKPFWRYD